MRRSVLTDVPWIGPSRFSTIVENSVENSGLSGLATMKTLMVSGSAYGEGRWKAFFTLFSRL
jgi:hypothetical protein